MSKAIMPGGMGVLVAWAVHDCREALGAELEQAGFTPLLLRKICHASIVSGPLFISRQHHIAEGWTVNPDLTLRIMTTTRASVPLPCSRSKERRVWSFLLGPHRTIFLRTQELWGCKEELLRIDKALDKQLADAASESLSERITAGDISKNRQRLAEALRKRKLLSQRA